MGGQFSAGLCSPCPKTHLYIHQPAIILVNVMGGCFVLQIKPHHVKRALKYASVKMSLSSVAGAMSNLKGIYPMYLLAFHFHSE